MCKNNIGNIKGRVLLQVYPNEAYDTQAVLESARAYAREFERVGTTIQGEDVTAAEVSHASLEQVLLLRGRL